LFGVMSNYRVRLTRNPEIAGIWIDRQTCRVSDTYRGRNHTALATTPRSPDANLFFEMCGGVGGSGPSNEELGIVVDCQPFVVALGAEFSAFESRQRFARRSPSLNMEAPIGEIEIAVCGDASVVDDHASPNAASLFENGKWGRQRRH